MAGREKSTRIVKKLKQTEERYRELFDSINICVAVYKAKKEGEDFVIKDFNTAAENVEKVSRRDIIGKSILEVFPAVKDFGIFEVMQRVWKSEVPERFPAKLYKDNRISGWRDNYVYKLPSGDIVTVYEDVTERIKGEKALEEAEQRYKIVADFTYDWEFWRSPQGKMLYVSPACERITGYTPAQFMKDPRLMDKIILPEDKSIHTAHLDRIKDIVSDKAIYRIKRKDGDVRWIEHVCRPILDDNGTFLGTRGSNRDITARKKAEEKLEESEDKYRTILESMDEAYYETDIKGNLTFFNDALPRLLGYTREELLGMNYSKFIPAGDYAAIRDLYIQVYRTGGSSELHRQANIRKDGSTIYVEVSAFPIKNAGGEVTGFRGVTWDITTRIKAEEELKLRAELLDTATDSIYMMDLNGNFVYANEACYKTRGYTKEDFMSLKIHELVAPEYSATTDKRITEVASRGELNFESAHRRKDGSIFPVEIYARAIEYNGEKHLLSIARDVTERKRSEKEIRDSEEKYRTVVENAHEGIIVTQDGFVKYINHDEPGTLGFVISDFYSRPFIEFIHPDDRQFVIDRYRRRLAGERMDDAITIRVINPAGAILWIEIRAVLIEWEGKPATLNFVANITERKQAEDALLKSEEKYRLLAENVDDVIWTLDSDLHLTYISPSVLKMRNIEPEEAMRESLADSMTPASWQRAMDELERNRTNIEKGEDISVQLEIEHYRKDGSIVPVELGIRALYDGDGKHTGFIGISRDITARKQAEDALRKSEEQYRLLADHTTDSVWLMDMNLKTTYHSPSIEKIRGFTAQEIMEMPLEQNLTPASLKLASEVFLRELPRIEADPCYNPLITLNLEYYCKDGSARWAENKFSVIRDPGGKPVSIMGEARDITERVQAEEAMRKSEETYRLLAENADDVIWTLDAGMNYTYISPSIRKLSGFEPEEAMRLPLEKILTPQSLWAMLHELEMDWDNVIKGKKGPRHIEFEQYRKDGSTVWVETVVHALYNEAGQLTGFMGSSRDITARKQAEQRLRESESKFSAAFIATSDPASITEAEFGKIIDANPAWEGWLGFSHDELIGRNTADLNIWAEPGQRDLMLEILNRQGELIDHEIRVRHKDGQVREVLFSARFIDIGEKQYLFSRARDITERKRAEKSLEQINRRLTDIIEFLPDATLAIDNHNKVILWNRAIEQMTGIAASEMIGKGDYAYTIPFYGEVRPFLMDLVLQDSEHLRARYPYILQDGNSFISEVFCPALNGGKGAWVFAKASPLHDRDGNIIGVIESIRDVTASKQAEEDLRRSEEQYRLLAENAGDTIWTMDSKLVPTYVSPAIRKLRGFEPDEAMRQTIKDQCTPSSFEVTQRVMKRAWTDAKNGIIGTYRVVAEQYRKDGSTVWVETTIRPFNDDADRLAGFIGVSRDVTQRVQAEEKVSTSEEKYRLLAENSEDVIWTVDASFIYTYVSPSIFKLRGFKPEEIVGQPIISTLTAQSQQILAEQWGANSNAAQEGTPVSWRGEIHAARKDGSMVWTEVVVRSLHDDNGSHIGFIGVSRDISERKAADEALRESQAKYYELLENAGESILIAQDGLVKFVNSRLIRLTGYSAADYLNTSFTLYIHKDDVEMVSAKYIARMRGEPVESNYTFRMITKGGDIRLVQIHAALATWEGRPATLNFLSDITERRKTEEALKESEGRYRLLAEHTDDVLWVLDRDLHLTYVSPSIRKLRGIEPEEAMQEDFASIMTPQSLQKILHLLKVNLPSIEGGRDGSARIEIEQYRKDRSTVWVELDMNELRDDTGKFIGFTGTTRDISARKASEQALRESEEKFRNIFEQSKDAIFITDKDGNLLDVNDSLCDLAGYSRDEILRPSPLLQDASRRFLSVIAKTGFLHDVEYTLQRRDGASISVLINATVRTDKSGNILGYQGIIHDITERKRLDEERQKTARLESIGTLAGGIAHDFNNILGAIIGNISLAKTEIPPGQGAHDLMKDAEKAVMRAKELTRQLLTFSRGGAPVKKRTQLTNTITDTANFAIRGTNVRCRFNIADDLKLADVDEGQISQVIQNLVINARQAMPAGGDIDIISENINLTEEMRLGRSLPLSPGIYIRITVKDNGNGIKPEHLDKIFDPYFTTKQSGSGLGLATCYSIIRNHGGHISVDSSPGHGSTFYVYLPAAEGPAEQAGKGESKEAIHMNGSVLVMDDEDALRTIISNMLKRLGFGHIEVAASGEEALGLYIKAMQAKQPFDVVILDLTVPGGMGGKETLEKLREVDPKVIAIVSSGYANEAIMSDYTRYGFKGVIVKPYTFDELKSALHEIMEHLKHK